jgi:hypothetical protein
MLGFIVLILVFLIFCWILAELVGYVPTNTIIPSWLFVKKPTESFIASMVQQKIPSLSGDNNAVDSVLDSNILRAQRTYPNTLFSKTEELDFPMMNLLVGKILNDNNINVSETYGILNAFKNYKVETIDDAFVASTYSKDDISLKKVLFHLLASVNKQVLMSDFNSPYHAYKPMTIMEYTVIEKSKTTDEKYTRYKLHVQMGRPYKVQTFIFYADVIVDSQESDGFYQIKTLEIVGTPVEHLNNMASEDFRKSLLTKSEPSLDEVFVNYPIIGSFGKPNDDITINEAKIAHDESMKSYKCFHPDGNYGELPLYYNELDCISYHAEVKGVGVWDKPCKSNADCPFYQANKNYPNTLGGCDAETNKCQMPLGIVRVGYRKYSKKKEPMCYNCPDSPESSELGDSNRCCKQQKQPDYMFEDDSNIRRGYTSLLESKGLQANPML